MKLHLICFFCSNEFTNHYYLLFVVKMNRRVIIMENPTADGKSSVAMLKYQSKDPDDAKWQTAMPTLPLITMPTTLNGKIGNLINMLDDTVKVHEAFYVKKDSLNISEELFKQIPLEYRLPHAMPVGQPNHAKWRIWVGPSMSLTQIYFKVTRA